jgi:hypothetical protein
MVNVNDLLAGVQSHELDAFSLVEEIAPDSSSLTVASGCPRCTWQYCRFADSSASLVRVSPDMMVFGLKVSELSLRREEIQQLDDIEHNVDRQNLGDTLKWKAADEWLGTVATTPDSSFVSGTCSLALARVDHRAT